MINLYKQFILFYNHSNDVIKRQEHDPQIVKCKGIKLLHSVAFNGIVFSYLFIAVAFIVFVKAYTLNFDDSTLKMSCIFLAISLYLFIQSIIAMRYGLKIIGVKFT